MSKYLKAIRIGVDLMGSDSSPDILFEAVLEAIHHLGAGSKLVVFAPEDVCQALQHKNKGYEELSIEWVKAPQEILMEDSPLEAIRRKPLSSMVLGLQHLKQQKIDGLVSAGNTGALLFGSMHHIALLPGIDRPALLIALPTEKGNTVIVDAGGNLTCRVEHYLQFAQLGAVFQKCIHGIICPTVGLLNVGEEPLKGHPELRKAYQYLCEYTQKFTSKNENFPFCFLGNIEGRDLFQGKVDVLVTDGFTGNILLKTCEGIAAFILKSMRQKLKSHKISSLESDLDEMQRLFDYTEHPGGLLCGLESIVIKCHGNVTSRSMFNCILGAANLIENNLILQMKQHFN